MTNLTPVLLAARDGRPATVNELCELGPELIQSCETPRQRIQDLKQRLLSAGGAPVLPVAVTFEKAGLSQRKQIANGFELRIHAGDLPLSLEDRQRALNSFWELDRVVAYQTLGETIATPAEVRELSQHVQRERNRAILEADGSLMALHCGLHALDDSLKRLSDRELVDVAPVVRSLVADVESCISPTDRRQYSDQIKARVGRMRDRLLTVPGV
jgi:hypothetical protein